MKFALLPVIFTLCLLGVTATAAADNGCKSPNNKPETQQAIKKAEGMGCKCVSGFRTRAQQAAAYARHKGRPGAAAKPGNSRHERGLAFDCPKVIQCPNGYKRLNNAAHKGMSHCSDTGG